MTRFGLQYSMAQADANVVMSHDGGIIEIQATGEKRPISQDELNTLLKYAKSGIETIRLMQQEACEE